MDENNIPLHVGLIMDGNGRWAKRRILPRSAGHNSGMKRMIALAEHARARGVKYLTVYALSTENLQRPKSELEGLYGLFRKYFTSNVKKLYKNNAGVKIIGDLAGVPDDVAALLKEGEVNSPSNCEFTLVFAINYGSRSEIVRACNLAVEGGQPLSEEQFSKLLYTSEIPDPDLIIRTGGEFRLSNFLAWQSAYSELYFTDVLFPDFTDDQFDKALEEYSRRDRRFGKLSGTDEGAK